MERVYLAGIKLALGVPRQTSTLAVMQESGALRLKDAAERRFLGQLIRLHETDTGKSLLERLAQRSNSRHASTLGRVRTALPYIQQSTPLLWAVTPPWNVTQPTCVEYITDLRRKHHSPLVMRALAQDYIEVKYPDALQVFTDGSVHKGMGSSAAAFTIPALEVDWSARLEEAFSSTFAELVAIHEALSFAVSLPNDKPLVILTDSRCAIQRIVGPYPIDTLIETIRSKARSLSQALRPVTIQWVPSHVGIPGNERADRLARDAHHLSPSISCPWDPRRPYRDVRKLFLPVTDPKAPPSPAPCVFKGFSRKENTLLLRLRTRSARTTAWLNKVGVLPSPLCMVCQVPETASHLLDVCPTHAVHRTTLTSSLTSVGVSVRVPSECIFPTGDVHRRRQVQKALLVFLRDTGLADTI